MLQLPGTARRARNEEEESQGIDNDTVHSFADFGSVVSTDEAQIEDDAENNPYIADYLQREREIDDIDLAAPSDEFDIKRITNLAPAPVRESSLISDEIRKSAASALIRGPPASRHFGGNRGGLNLSSQPW